MQGIAAAGGRERDPTASVGEVDVGALHRTVSSMGLLGSTVGGTPGVSLFDGGSLAAALWHVSAHAESTDFVPGGDHRTIVQLMRAARQLIMRAP